MDKSFWTALEELVNDSPLVIDRPRGTAHPRYPQLIYEVDYGYLSGTHSMDGGGIDVWRGSDPARRIDAIMCVIDRGKKDIKILIGCTPGEMDIIARFHNQPGGMRGLLIRR